MPFTLEQLAEEVFTLRGAYNGISDDVKELKHQGQESYNKTERDKTELIDRIERNKTELIERIERDKTELIERIEKSKTDMIKWMFVFWIGQLAALVAIIKIFFG